MSADNFVVVRQFKDGWYYADLSASYWWENHEVYPDSAFNSGPYATENEAADAALSDGYVEYGLESDNKLEGDPITTHPKHGSK